MEKIGTILSTVSEQKQKKSLVKSTTSQTSNSDIAQWLSDKPSWVESGVHWVWGRMAQAYGSAWVASYGAKPNLTWAQAVYKVGHKSADPYKMVMKTVAEVIKDCDKFVPKAGRFINIGLELRRSAAIHPAQYKALPEPDIDLNDPNVIAFRLWMATVRECCNLIMIEIGSPGQDGWSCLDYALKFPNVPPFCDILLGRGYKITEAKIKKINERAERILNSNSLPANNK